MIELLLIKNNSLIKQYRTAYASESDELKKVSDPKVHEFFE